MDQETHNRLRRSILRIVIDIADQGQQQDLHALPGIIVAFNDRFCHIIAFSRCFLKCIQPTFKVYFPNNLCHEIMRSSVRIVQGVAAFDISAENVGYDTSSIEAIQIGKEVSQADEVFAFIFPDDQRPSVVTPGSVCFVNRRTLYHDCSPSAYTGGAVVLNKTGQLVGICYGCQSYLRSWTTFQLTIHLAHMHEVDCEDIEDYVRHINQR